MRMNNHSQWRFSCNLEKTERSHNGGLNIALHALNDLTNGNAVAWGHVDAQVNQVASSYCGL